MRILLSLQTALYFTQSYGTTLEQLYRPTKLGSLTVSLQLTFQLTQLRAMMLCPDN